jgi:threonine dehydratase
MTVTVTIEDVREAARRIAPHVHRTPVMTSATLDRELGAEVFFKCENFQKIGAFKVRGATNAVLSLSDEEARRGVIAHSSGNHAAALAYAANIRGVPCTVVMPKTSAPIKKAAVRGYGARIVESEQAEREQVAAAEMERTGAVMIEPYDNARIIAGQGTATLELMEDIENLEMVIAPVGGGGLLAGTAVAAHGMDPDAEVWGAEPEAVDDAFRSLREGKRQPGVTDPRTLADGLLTGLGELNFKILTEHGVRVVTVSEAAIVEACVFHLQRMKMLVEPSAGVGLAALRKLGDDIRGRRIGVILSGGNTDLAWFTKGTP